MVRWSHSATATRDPAAESGDQEAGAGRGSTNSRAEVPKDRPITVPQVLSTFYQAIGIDASQTFPDGSGRPMYVLDDRQPVSDLLG